MDYKTITNIKQLDDITDGEIDNVEIVFLHSNIINEEQQNKLLKMDNIKWIYILTNSKEINNFHQQFRPKLCKFLSISMYTHSSARGNSPYITEDHKKLAIIYLDICEHTVRTLNCSHCMLKLYEQTIEEIFIFTVENKDALNNLPNNIKIIHLGLNKNEKINNLPINLKKLIVYKQRWNLDITETIETLKLPFDCELEIVDITKQYW